jgi:hypothetical protein
MYKHLITLLLFGYGTGFASSVCSPVFDVNTTHLFSRASSEVFSCNTDHVFSGEISQIFIAATGGLKDSQASLLFLCDSRSPSSESATFLADTHTVLIDSDGNGLPDLWEMTYFGILTNTPPLNDYDNDGSNNQTEYIAGTHPKNAGSVFVVEMSSTASSLTWNGVLNRLYTVQCTTNLSIPFADVPGYVDLQGADSPSYFINYGIGEIAFFRVKVRINE